jgi:hypothetical protein
LRQIKKFGANAAAQFQFACRRLFDAWPVTKIAADDRQLSVMHLPAKFVGAQNFVGAYVFGQL